ncbi:MULTISPECIES: urease accessory protein UreD [unclassified Oceanobacter]|uniref:urease accessory protein UreD n=1 Tax=unclassified Oceanobacter TaxID=2620260 RepID=UPI0027349C6B|nr:MULTISPECIES: urease accessory protein UreD [unclassified Oceanobacter]MDP2609795.1 urease accessory protein UreD [Oceanobacter sp. 1_MG-2023]MDP2613126.1 urease accessory protein UreD [Oceanobacter sp. 2_MG-2023]
MNMPVKEPASVPPAEPSRWNASLALGISRTARGSVLKSNVHHGPLYVQKPFYPEGRELAHVYLLHPPGGMVSGDTLAISASLGPAASALITTPGAGRAYKARADKTLQRQTLRFELAEQATLEWLPLESIIYPGANTRLDTDVYLSAGASYIGWDVTSLGLPASSQPFSADSSFTQNLNLFRDGRLVLRERLVVDGQQGLYAAMTGLQSMPISGMMVAGPFLSDGSPGQPDGQALLTEEHIQQLRELLQPDGSGKAYLTGVTLNHDFLIIRYLGHCSEQGRSLFTRCWQEIRPLLTGRNACAPRIWAT